MSFTERGLPFKLPAAALRDIGLLCTMGQRVSEIAECAQLLLSEVPFGEYPSAISDRTGMPVAEVAGVINAIQNLRSLQQLLEIGAEELLTRFDASFREEAPDDWKKQYLSQWEEARERIAKVLAALRPDHALVLMWKSESLVGAYEKVLGDSIILTDIRPVFDSQGETVLQATVSHALLIDYFEGQQRRRIQLALDATDLEDLKKACERAQRKACSLKDGLSRLPWPTTIPRAPDSKAEEDGNESGSARSINSTCDGGLEK